MSFDLFFYKRNGSQITKEDITNYLVTKLDTPVENDQLLYENQNTDVYYIFDFAEYDDMEGFEGFEKLNLSFQLNYLRPDFFGKEAFLFITTMLTDLDLYVFNIQTGELPPHQPVYETIYKYWSDFNAETCKEHYKKEENNYYPLEKSNRIWAYNYQRPAIQAMVEDNCFVSRFYFFKEKASGEVKTYSVWPDCIPFLAPPSDYYFLRRMNGDEDERGLVSYETLHKTFGEYFKPFNIDGCKILDFDSAIDAEDAYHSIKFEHSLEDFAEQVDISTLFNTKRAD